jgi:pimeloyl-ACP methyl ester carboxylesterase
MLVRSLSTKCNLAVKATVPLAWEEYKARAPTKALPAPRVLLLHGLLGSKRVYRSLGRQLSRGGTDVTNVDLRNHGELPQALPLDSMTMARDVAQFLRQHQLTNVVLVGHLMGAKVAMLVALTHPQLVALLVVVDNTPAYTPLDQSFRDKVSALAYIEQLRLDASDPNRDVALRRAFDKFGVSAQVRLYLMANLADGPHVRFVNPTGCFVEHDVVESVSQWPEREVQHLRYDKPVLVLRSTQLGFVPTMEPFGRYFGHVRAVSYDADHYTIVQRAAAAILHHIQ